MAEKFDGEMQIICPKCLGNASSGSYTFNSETGEGKWKTTHCCDMCNGTGMVDIEYRIKTKPESDFTIVPGQILKAVANE